MTTVFLALTFHIVFLILVFGVIMSIAWSGVSLTTTSAMLSRWFQHQHATVLNLSTAGASAGGVLLVPLTMAVLQRTDWRITWVVPGVLVLVVALPLAFLFLRDDPTDLGLLPAALSAFSIREKKYAAKEQNRPVSTSAVPTTT